MSIYKIQCNGKDIKWEHLVSVYKSGTGADRPVPGLSQAHKLKYEHIYLTSFSKMRVDLAAEVYYNYSSTYKDCSGVV